MMNNYGSNLGAYPAAERARQDAQRASRLLLDGPSAAHTKSSQLRMAEYSKGGAGGMRKKRRELPTSAGDAMDLPAEFYDLSKS